MFISDRVLFYKGKKYLLLRPMRNFLLFVLFSFSVSAFGQSVDDDQKMHLMRNRPFPKDTIWPKLSTVYYDDYSNQLGLFLQAKHKTTNVIITDRLSDSRFDYSPKNQLYLGPGFTYKLIGNGLSLSFGLLNNKDKGEPVKRIDIYVNFILKKVVFDFGFRFYQNFTLKNSADYSMGSSGGDYVRPDIKTIYMGVGGVYVLNHEKFSYRATFTQTAIQKKSAGSLMLGAQVFLQGMMGDSSIFPSSAGLPNVTSNSSVYLGLTAAYAYNFVFEKYYFLAMALSSTLELGKAVTLLNHNERYTNHYPILHLQPRIVLGINKPKWYFGASIRRDYYQQLFKPDDSRFDFVFNTVTFKVFYGHRFNWLSRKQLRE